MNWVKSVHRIFKRMQRILTLPKKKKKERYFDGNYELIAFSDEETSAKEDSNEEQIKISYHDSFFFEGRIYMAASQISNDVFFELAILMIVIWMAASSILQSNAWFLLYF